MTRPRGNQAENATVGADHSTKSRHKRHTVIDIDQAKPDIGGYVNRSALRSAGTLDALATMNAIVVDAQTLDVLG
jgi:hypothetical protein